MNSSNGNTFESAFGWISSDCFNSSSSSSSSSPQRRFANFGISDEENTIIPPINKICIRRPSMKLIETELFPPLIPLEYLSLAESCCCCLMDFDSSESDGSNNAKDSLTMEGAKEEENQPMSVCQNDSLNGGREIPDGADNNVDNNQRMVTRFGDFNNHKTELSDEDGSSLSILSTEKRILEKHCLNQCIALINTCRHTFHFECIIRWAGRENSCPQCKLRFLAIGVYSREGRRLFFRYTKKTNQTAQDEQDEQSDLDNSFSFCFICREAANTVNQSSESNK